MTVISIQASTLTLLAGTGFFLGVTILLVIVLLLAKHYLVNSGEVTIDINGDRKLTASSGKSLLSTMADNNVEAKAVADNAAYRSKKAEAKFFPPKPSISPARK